MKINRLFSIVHILLNKERTTAGELAKEFECSTRTIYRDIETLSMSGIPVYTDKGNGGGISILKDFVLDKSVMTEEEKNSLLLGLEILQTAEYNDNDIALNNLKKLFSKNSESFLEVDFTPFDNNIQKLKFEQIKDALKKSQSIELQYKNKSNALTKRIINPLKLIFKKKRWYLIAWCHSRNDYRTFRISRIEAIQQTGFPFNREDYDIENYRLTSFDSRKSEAVVLILSKSALFRVKEELFSSEIKVLRDYIKVSFDTEIDEWMTNYVMSYADYLLDCSPEKLKDKLKKKAEKILKI
jgi:predicted DNA-binding transcriptional regulator YafY